MSRTPADYSMEVVRGATWEDSFDYQDAAGEAIDLTGYQARMQVRTPEGQYGTTGAESLVLELTTENGLLAIPTPEDGQVLLRVEATDTDALNPDNLRKLKLVYALELYQPETFDDPEYVIPLVRGTIIVRGNAVR